MIFWLNGDFREDPTALHVLDRGLLLGDGAFETILLIDSRAAFLTQHLTRFRRTLEALELPVVLPADLASILADLARANQLQSSLAAARFTVTRGTGARGLLFPHAADTSPTRLITVHQTKVPSTPARLHVSAYHRFEKSLLSQHKTLNYGQEVMARNHAERRNCHEALMLNSKSRLACASAANIILSRPDGSLITPALAEGALPGIVKGILLKRAKEDGLPIQECSIGVPELERCSIFLTNSLIGIRPGYLEGTGRDLPISATGVLQQLRSWYEDELRIDLSRL